MEPLTSIFTAIQLIIMLIFISSCPQPAMSRPHNNFTDLESLLSFKAALTDPYGILATNWTTNISFCSWIGVSCSPRHQRVVGIRLRSISLEGTISPHLANLSFLSRIDLKNNTITGTIPDDIGRLPRLATLELERNYLSGSIPFSIFNMSSLTLLAVTLNNLTGSLPIIMPPQLQSLYLSKNQFTGKIPSSLGLCSHLEVLSVSINEFSGIIPADLGNISGLNKLYLGSNQFTGTIPKSLGNLTELQILDLSYSDLHGEIPKEFGNLVNIQFLHLAYNSLIGSIPVALFNDSKLYFLDLAGNNLTGSIPDTLGNSLTQIQTLGMHYNQLTGGLDFIASLSNCKVLQWLSVTNNEIEGVLPNSIGNLSTQLEYFYADTNHIEGKIPVEFGNLSNLILLQLQDNKLSGEIPRALSRLQRIQMLDLSDNRINGSIHFEFGLMTSLSYLYLQENILSGPIPDSLGNLTNLQHLLLDGNRLQSNIPNSMWSLRGLIELSLSKNALQGSLLQQIGNLKSLSTLDLSNNRLSGNISSALGELQMLTRLDLSNNSFNGEIPMSFAGLISIKVLNLSHNSLSGAIPKSLANLHNLGILDLSFNKLEGHIPVGGIFSNVSVMSLQGNALLCGAPQLGFSPCSSTVFSSNSKNKAYLLRYILPPIISIFLLLVCAVLLFVSRRRSTKAKAPSKDASFKKLRLISYDELVRATDNFSSANFLGRGSMSSVFKACLDAGLIAAVKVLNLEVQGASSSFDAECRALSIVRHRNLVKIISTCSNMEFKALILEYMPNGSLENWLYSPTCYLNLLQRINVMVDVSFALEYLHHHHPHILVHRDLKPGNVLLDENMVARVGDFGIAKLLLGVGDSKAILSESAPGTIGYMPPEYGCGGKVSRKGDVYSFGVLLLETFTRKRPTDAMFGGELSLKQWVSNAHPDAVLEIIDFNLLREETVIKQQSEGLNLVRKCLSSVIELGLLCSRDSPKERPLMKDVVPILQKIKMDYLSKLPTIEASTTPLPPLTSVRV